jgi:hypothetical protein
LKEEKEGEEEEEDEEEQEVDHHQQQKALASCCCRLQILHFFFIIRNFRKSCNVTGGFPFFESHVMVDRIVSQLRTVTGEIHFKKSRDNTG